MSNHDAYRNISRLTRRTLAMVLAGGRGEGLGCLTLQRTDAALLFAGKFRLIDFPLSNCVNSGIRQIGVLTQYRPRSLIRHLSKGWGFLDSDRSEFIDLLPPANNDAGRGYAGTADALWQNLDLLDAYQPELVLVLAADHVYKMDYGPMLAHHAACGADLTIAGVEVPIDDARGRYGVMGCNAEGRIGTFSEKPERPPELPNRPRMTLASMGIYVFSAAFLRQQLELDAARMASSHDFARDLIPHCVEQHHVQHYPFRDPGGRQPYWRDIGDIDAYYRANLELIEVEPALNLYDREWPILTHQLQLPPAKFVFEEQGRTGMALNSMVSGGCIISGASVERSLLFSSVIVEDGSVVQDSMLLPRARIGRGCRIRRAIIESGVELPDGTVIGEDHTNDAVRHYVTPEGITLVCDA